MSDEYVSKFEEKLDKIVWTQMLYIHIFIMLVASITSYIVLNNVTPSSTSYSTVFSSFISNSIFVISTIFGGYYFTKLFFKTNLKPTDFYKFLMYLYLPLFAMYVVISIMGVILSYVSIDLLPFLSILYLPLIYYAIKELNTSIYIFKKEFNTSDFPLVGVVIVWHIIVNTISTLLFFIL